jgi:hypothetical protein
MKVKSPNLLISAPHHNDIWECDGRVSCTINFNTRELEVNGLQSSPDTESPQHPLNRKLAGPRTNLNVSGEIKIS